jgi:hypothetical protein
MLTRRTMLMTLGALATIADRADAQPAAPNARRVFQHDLPNIDLSDWSVTAVEVASGPGDARDLCVG